METYVNDLSGDAPVRPEEDEPEDVEVIVISKISSDSGRVIQTVPFDLASGDGEKGSLSSVESVEKELEAARGHLRNNELDDALSLAMEVARLRPELVEAKLIIARCFINRKEYRKAQAILQAIPETGKDAEIYYHLGLCRGRIRDIPGAIEALEKSVAIASDKTVCSRAEDLLAHLKSGEAVCSECGQKTTSESMTDIGDKTVCTACAAALSGVMKQVAPEAGTGQPVRGNGSLAGWIRKAAVIPFLAAFVYLALYILSIATPSGYKELRTRLPAAWSFLPKAELPSRSTATPGSTEQAANAATLHLDSPVIEYAIAGVPLSRTVTLDGKTVSGDMEIRFTPEPHGRYRASGKSGTFTWTPSETDAGQAFDIALDVTIAGGDIAGQNNRVQVFSPPRFRALYQPGNIEPDTITHLLAADCTGNGLPEIVMVQGRYQSGRISVLQETADGFFHPMGGLELSGRPAGAGIVNVDGEQVACVADYWNSALRYFLVRDGSVRELPLKTPTPGRPILASFGRDAGIIAVLCHSDKGMRLVAHRAIDETHVEKIGDWDISDSKNHIWRKVLVLPELKEAGSRSRILLVGSDPAQSVFLLGPEKNEPERVVLAFAGTIVDAAASTNGRVCFLLENKGQYRVVAFSIDAMGRPAALEEIQVGANPFLNGVAFVNPFGVGNGDDIALLSATRLGYVVSGLGEKKAFVHWLLPSPSRLLGPVGALPGENDRLDRVLYLDAEGSLWSAEFSGELRK